MTTQTAPVQLGVVPAPKEIENTMGARKILEAAIEDFKNKRSTAKAELANSLGKDLAVAQLDVASAMARYNAWKTSDDALAAKIKACDELRPIIEELEEELKKNQRDAVVAYLKGKLLKLETEMASEEGKEALLKQEIAATKKRLHELEKPPYAEAAKSKKG